MASVCQEPGCRREAGACPHCKASPQAPSGQQAEPDMHLLQEIEYARDHGWPLESRQALERICAAIKGRRALAGQQSERPAPAPIDMVLFCPDCGMQHIDAPDDRTPDWKNEPHRSHLCHGCGHIWRPADVPTNGVAAVKTKGKADSPTAERPAPAGLSDDRLEQAMAIINAAWAEVPEQYRNPDADDSTGNPLPAAVRAMAAGQAVGDLREALEEIVDPISFMKKRLKEGERLDGHFAYSLSRDSAYLKGIARAALAASQAERPAVKEGDKP